MRTLVTVFIVILLLSFFGISIRGILESPTGKDNLTFLSELIHTGFKIIEGYIYIMMSNLKEISSFVGANQS